ncbi:MAG: hypothetical protein H8E57_07785 [Candidatus Cloacimonetes bacterium]|nr:hypothetical protein [Candidatus Cloacimonadota bacterium]
MKLFLFLLLIFPISISANVHTSYLWHLQQPIYWSEQSEWNSNQYQYVWESQYLKDNNGNWYSDSQQHPLNNLNDIFGLDDRKAAYQYRTRDAVQSLLGHSEAGAQVNYSGCLMQNVNSLADAGQWGYYSGWQNSFTEARNWTTSGGKPRMDVVGFSMHHVISPLVDENCLRKQIQAHRYIYGLNFGSTPDYSNGYWPAECSFSERIIQVLVEEGFEWSVIANSHLARTLADYPINYGTGGCNIDPPNPADIVSINGYNWWSGQIDARGGTFAAPYCYQAHKAKYVNPESGQEFLITVVPMCDLLSYQNGYGTMGTGDIDSHIAPYDDPSYPSIVLMAHDGDNAWGGGYSYYGESVPDFVNAAASQGYSPTTVEQFLTDHPVLTSDVVHVEDGSWVNASNDWGHPQFINWLWPMYDGNYDFDQNGWTEDARNWAVLTAAENRVEMAEEFSGTLDIAQIVYPDGSANLAEKAWHYLLPGYTSGYMYYGTSLDMEVKPSLACNLATDLADQVIDAHPGEDDTAPTIFIPQRYPYNPGGNGYGPTYDYQEHQNSSDFYVWTFAYDVSGMQSIELKYRLDSDGINPLTDNDNDIYSGGTGVGSWNSISMTERVFPTGNVTGNPDIDFFITPNYIANEYYAEITGLNNVLVDYYIEAADNYGNTKKTPIQHVYVGEYNPGGGDEEIVWWNPENPSAGDDLAIYYGEDAMLFGASQIYIHLGTNDWENVDDYAMTFNPSENRWEYVTSTTIEICQVDFVFNDGLGAWDNNSGSDWYVTVTGCSEPEPFIMDGQLDENSEELGSNAELFFNAGWNGIELYVASPTAQSLGEDVFIFISENPITPTAAPWAKSGQIANWDAYLANESSNGWNGWFENSGAVANISGTVLEGTINISEELGHIPDQIYIALGTYGTNDGEGLYDQLPAGNLDNNIDPDEFYEYVLNLQVNTPQNISIEFSENQITLNWEAVSGADYYKVYSDSNPYGDFSNLEETDILNTFWSEPVTEGIKFYKVSAVNE